MVSPVLAVVNRRRAIRSRLRKHLGVYIRKALELQRITAGVADEQGGLFARLAGKADAGAHDEVVKLVFQSLRQDLPLIHGQHQSEMGHGYLMSVHQRVHAGQGAGWAEVRVQMHHQLVAEKVEVDPAVGTATHGQAEAAVVEVARLVDIPNLNGKVKWC